MTNEPAPPADLRKPTDRFMMLVLAYLWVLALVPLLSHASDPEVRWHARHGVVLMIVEFGALVAWEVLFGLVWIMTGGLFGCVASVQILFELLIGLVLLGFHIFLIARALHGHRVMVPYLSEYANRF